MSLLRNVGYTIIVGGRKSNGRPFQWVLTGTIEEYLKMKKKLNVLWSKIFGEIYLL